VGAAEAAPTAPPPAGAPATARIVSYAIALRHCDPSVSLMGRVLATLNPIVPTSAAIFAKLTPSLTPGELVVIERSECALSAQAAAQIAGGGAFNPFAPAHSASVRAGILSTQDLPESQAPTLPGYLDRFLRPNGLCHQAVAYLGDGDRPVATVTLLRGSNLPGFDAEETAFLAQARPFLEAAFKATTPRCGVGTAAALGLTAREREVARLTANGLNNAEIADALKIKLGTVKTHLTRVYVKLGVQSRTELIAVIATRVRQNKGGLRGDKAVSDQCLPV